MRLVFHVLNGLMAALFLFAAALQYNDEDILRWMAIYLAAAAASLLVMAGRARTWMPAIVLAVAVGWSAIYAARGAWTIPFREMFAEWEMKNQQVVEEREMFGLLIVAAWMLVLIVAIRRQQKARSPLG